MNLDELFDYKNKFFEHVLTNEKLVQLINEEKTLATAEELCYTQLYPFENIPETIEHGHTYVCCEVDVTQSSAKINRKNSLIYTPTLYIWILVHKSNIRLPCGGVRYDAICSEIANVINESLEYGVTPLRLASVRRFTPLTDYQGKVMTFTSDDINWVYDPLRPVPDNRKRDA